MIDKIFKYLVFMLLPFTLSAQVINTATMDTVETTLIGHVSVGGYVDSYYGYNFSKPTDGANPYFVSSARSNEFTINLAYVDVRYRSKYMRARFVPGFGTYMDANYKNEPGSLKNIVEANVGVILSEKRKIWLDVGVLVSPYTNESAISKDHLMYTRSFGTENVPYYVTGVKLSVPINEKLNAYLYVMNGWQVIQDNNQGKSIGTQLEYRPNKSMLFNWNTYVGDERSNTQPNFRTRIFNDFYWIFNPGGKFSATSCFYFGYQERLGARTVSWWQANFIGNYKFNETVSLSGRVEHFSDEGAIYQTSITGTPGFRASSAGACVNFKLHRLALLRFEARKFFSTDDVYLDKNQNPTNGSMWLVGSLTAWF
ncbi:hypothetical protein BH10BAC4_BH10BAC4_21600 [soil metagenome]